MARILIAEGEAKLRLLFSAIVRRCGWDPLEADAHSELVDQVREFKPDAVVGTLASTEAEALEVLESIRDEGVPVILVSVHGDPGHTADALHAGAADYLVISDLSIDHLREKVAPLLGRGPTATRFETLSSRWRSLSGIPAELDPEAIRARLRSIHELAVLSPVATRLVGMVENERTNARDLTAVISADPGLASRLLSFANSAFYRGQQPCASIERAIVRIGFSSLRSMALAIAVLEVEDDAEGLSIPHLYEHSVAAAVLAEGLATASGAADPDTAFLCGLLHDVGKVVLKQALPRKASRIHRWSRTRDIPSHRLEQRTLAMDHCRVGALVLERWNIAPQIVRPIAHHHVPHLAFSTLTAAEQVLATIVYLADNLAKSMLQYADEGDHLEHAGFNHVEFLGLDRTRIDRCMAESRPGIDELRGILLGGRRPDRDRLLKKPPTVVLVREAVPPLDVVEVFLRELGCEVVGAETAMTTATVPQEAIVLTELLDPAEFHRRVDQLRDGEDNVPDRLRRHILVTAGDVPREELNAARAGGLAAVTHPVSIAELIRAVKRAKK